MSENEQNITDFCPDCVAGTVRVNGVLQDCDTCGGLGVVVNRK